MSPNQRVLAKMDTMQVMSRLRRGPQPSPAAQLLLAVEEAIADARGRRDELVASGLADSGECQKIEAQIARWEEARRINR